MKAIVFLPVTGLLATAAFPHHSYLQYSQEIGELQGTLLAVEWKNPHAGFEISVSSEAGEEETWYLESFSSPYVLSRMDVKRQDFTVGDQIRVAGRASLRERNRLLLTHLLRGDGTEVILFPDGEPFWANEQIGGRENWADERIATALSEDRGIFRVWSLDRLFGGTRNFAYTPEAIAARESFDEVDSFVENCEQPGMPTSMLAAFPFEFIDRGDRLTLRNEYHDVVRTIHMTERSADDQPRTRQGYSVGHWEDERTLVVHTTRVDWPFFDNSGTPQSEAAEITERFALSEDQATLEYRVIVDDPAVFTAPATRDRTFLALNETIQPFDCQVD